MARLTREQTQARTKARVLAAAEKVFLARGFHDATVDAIAEKAGYSAGAVYSNFASKAHLLSELIASRSAADQEEIAELVSRGTKLVDMARAVGEREGRLADQAGEWLLLEWECRVQMLRSAGMRRPRRRGHSERVAALGVLIAEALEKLGVTTAFPAEKLATVFLALSNGLAYHRLQFPEDVPDDLFPAAFALVAQGIEAAGASS